MTAVARDLGTPSKASTVEVMISVHEKTASLPVISNAGAELTVTEELGLNSRILNVKATGIGLGYEIVGGNLNDKFKIDSSGQITLNGQLDYEEVKKYSLIVRVISQAVTPKRYAEAEFTINVDDANDNSPVFAVIDPAATIPLTVDRHSPKGTVVSEVSATREYTLSDKIFDTMPKFRQFCPIFA